MESQPVGKHHPQGNHGSIYNCEPNLENCLVIGADQNALPHPKLKSKSPSSKKKERRNDLGPTGTLTSMSLKVRIEYT
jgi:hypothetical protein